MNQIMRSIKSFFGVYESGYEYWVYTNNVIISKEFQATTPGYKKIRSKEKTFLRYGVLSPIMINHDFELVDGYISFLLLQKYGCGKIPVFFVD